MAGLSRAGPWADFTTVSEANSQNPGTPIFLKYKLKNAFQQQRKVIPTHPQLLAVSQESPTHPRGWNPENLKSHCAFQPPGTGTARPAATLGDPPFRKRVLSLPPDVLWGVGGTENSQPEVS